MFANFPDHPGTVTFVGDDSVERIESAESLPVWLKFATAADGTIVPVVRIERVPGERGVGLRSYGPNGRLIAVTLPVPIAPHGWTERRPEPRIESARELSGWF